MTVDERLELSYYKTIAELNPEHEVYLVSHTGTNKIFRFVQLSERAVFFPAVPILTEN